MEPTASRSTSRGDEPLNGATSSSAPTVATWPPPCSHPTSRAGHRAPRARPGTPWSGTFAPRPAHLRGSRPARPPGVALSPDGRSLYTGSPADGVRRGVGHADLAPPRHRPGYQPRHRPSGNPARASRTRPGMTRFWSTPPTARPSTRWRVTGDSVLDIRFSPDGSLVGSVSRRWRADRLGPRHRPAAGSVGHLRPVRASASARTRVVHSGGARLDAAHLGPLRARDLSAADGAGRRQRGVRARRPRPRTAGASPTAGSTTGTGGGSGSSTRPPARRRRPPGLPGHLGGRFAWPSGTWHPDGHEYVTFCAVRVHDWARRRAWLDSSHRASSFRSRDLIDAREIYSLAYVDDGRSLLVGGDRKHHNPSRRRDPASAKRAVRHGRELLRHRDR